MKKLLFVIVFLMCLLPNYSLARHHHHHHSPHWGLPVGVAIGALVATASYNSTYNHPYRYPTYYRDDYTNTTVYRETIIVSPSREIKYETIIVDPYTGNQRKYITVY